MLICSLSAAMTPCNYEQTDSYILFLAKYQMFNLTCDSMLKYIWTCDIDNGCDIKMLHTPILCGDNNIAILPQH